ncbi:MAG: DNA polymerase II [Acidobacteriota bacterium]
MPDASRPLTTEAFLLTRSWRERRNGVELELWAASADGPLRLLVPQQELVCFIPSSTKPSLPSVGRRRSVELKSLGGQPVDACYFTSRRQLRQAQRELEDAGLPTFESDVKATDRYLMERFLRAGLQVEGKATKKDGWLELVEPRIRPAPDHRPSLAVRSLDIETEMDPDRLISIAVTREDDIRVFLLHDDGWKKKPRRKGLTVHADEAELLRAFFAWLKKDDPDVIIGWNVIDFDCVYLQRKCETLGVDFDLGRGEGESVFLPPGEGMRGHLARVPGRVILDGITLLHAATIFFEDYSLGAVAQEVIGKDKLLEGGPDAPEKIAALYHADPLALVDYNVVDCQLVEDVFDELHLLDFVIERSQLTGLELDRRAGSVAAFDNLYLPRLHREGHVAPEVGSNDSTEGSPGGHLLESDPGLFENVLLLDFKSLYPSIMGTFLIDPLGLHLGGDDQVPGFLGATFHRERHVLPELVREIWKARDGAKARGDRTGIQAIKILMNSFYGVLGTTICRFFDPRLASSITRRGHEILETTKAWIQEGGEKVIYGDTDSVFVLLGPDKPLDECRARGKELAASLTTRWRETLKDELRLDSWLELEFEQHFLRFLMPTMRHSEKGTKKRYAGLVQDGDERRVVFKGLESVRTDWTPLAREVQRELYRRVFLDEPWEDWLREVVSDLEAGRLDDQLVYRKRLRRSLDAYAEKGAPPHVQAARKLDKPGRWIRHVITVNGPEPVEKHVSALDHAHYRDKQLAPAVDGLLQFLDRSLEDVAGRQLRLF